MHSATRLQAPEAPFLVVRAVLPRPWRCFRPRARAAGPGDRVPLDPPTLPAGLGMVQAKGSDIFGVLLQCRQQRRLLGIPAPSSPRSQPPAPWSPWRSESPAPSAAGSPLAARSRTLPSASQPTLRVPARSGGAPCRLFRHHDPSTSAISPAAGPISRIERATPPAPKTQDP